MVVSCEGEKKQHACESPRLHNHYTDWSWVIYMDGSSKIFKYCNKATIAADIIEKSHTRYHKHRKQILFGGEPVIVLFHHYYSDTLKEAHTG